MTWLKTILETIKLFLKLLSLAKQAKKKRWIKNGNELVIRINNAKTDKQRRALVRALSKHRV